MSLYQYKGKSMPQRIVLVVLETIILAGAAWILFVGDETLSRSWGSIFSDGNTTRKIVLFSMFAIVYIRMMFTVFYLLKRSIHWEEAFTIPFAFGLYYIGFSLFCLTTNGSFTAWDYGSILLFLIGSWINTFSEWKRDQWKKRPENKGKVYTEGLFQYSAHVNYFGDVLWVTALALITHNPWALIIPVLLICLFVFFNIPALDRHLEQKYGDDFIEYQRKTNKLIPYIY